MSDVQWEYRVVRRITENNSDWYSVEEVYFDDDGSPTALTIDLQVEGENIEEMKTPEAILHLLQNNNQLTRQQLAEQIGKDVRTIARAIAKLQQTGKLTRAGSDKTGHWEVHL